MKNIKKLLAAFAVACVLLVTAASTTQAQSIVVRTGPVHHRYYHRPVYHRVYRRPVYHRPYYHRPYHPRPYRHRPYRRY